MNRFDTQLQNNSISMSPVSHSGMEPTHRLIVLVPNADLDYAAATRRVWELAGELGAHILFIGLCKETADELSLRRQLVTMTAMVQDGNASAEANVEVGSNWVSIVKRNYRSGDLVVCFAEQRAGLLQKPLTQILQSNLKIPVYILTDPSLQPPKSTWVSPVIAWSGFIAIILGFCMLQVRIIQLSTDWFQNIALILSIFPEFWLILVWNGRFE